MAVEYWTGRVYGTNRGNVGIRISQRNQEVIVDAIFDDHAYGIAKAQFAGVYSEQKKMIAKLTEYQGTSTMQPFEGELVLDFDEAVEKATGKWTTDINTNGQCLIRKKYSNQCFWWIETKCADASMYATRMGKWAALISAFAALLSAGAATFSGYVANQIKQFHIQSSLETKARLAPNDRPILALVKKNIDSLFADERESQLIVQSETVFTFKNVGKHPAKEIHLTLILMPKVNQKNTIILADSTIANTISPDNEFIWQARLEYKLRDLRLENAEAYIFIRLVYSDVFTANPPTYKEEYWLLFSPDGRFIRDATVEQMNDYKKYLDLKES